MQRSVFLCGVAANSSHNTGNQGTSIPNEIQQILKNPFYEGAIWGLRVVDFDTGELVYDLNPDTLFLSGETQFSLPSDGVTELHWIFHEALAGL